MTSTVTIPLQEYDRLKELEKELKEIKDNDFYCLYYTGGIFNNVTMRIKDKSEAMQVIKRDFEELKSRLKVAEDKLNNRKILGLFKI